MVRSLSSVVAITLAVGASGFAPSATFMRPSTDLCVSKHQVVKKTIGNLNKENFASSIAEVEPFLLETGASTYTKSMKRIKGAAATFGIEMDANYAKAAKATSKRRGKQDAFIQQKETERKEAEAAAAEAAAEAAAAPAEEVAEPVAEEATA
jgi:hypothetical protein